MEGEPRPGPERVPSSTSEPNVQHDQQWKYTIYLLGFPGVPRDSKSIPVVGMVGNLVPEARVFQDDLFSSDAAPHSDDIDIEDEADVEPSATNEVPTLEVEGESGSTVGEIDGNSVNKTHKREISGSEFDDADHTGSFIFDGMKSLPETLEHNGIEDSTSEARGGAPNFSSPAWIEIKALELLNHIQKHAPPKERGDQCKVLLAGYGFGGMVVKQAIVIANTTPRFYDVALNVASLVFFATPHRLTPGLAWEEVLIDMLRATNTSYRGRLSQILSGLVDSVSQLSHIFYRFAAKYPTTNFIENENAGDLERTKFNNHFEKIVPWLPEGEGSLLLCGVDDLRQLKSLRSCFAPSHMLSDQHEGVTKHVNGVSQAEVNDTYFEALQAFSPSRWILHETRTLDNPDDFNDLKEIYASLVRRLSLKDLRGGSIQVIGPAGYGKSALVKLISQKITQESSVVAIDNFANSFRGSPRSLYGLYVSFIHQSISQRPTLFRPVQNLMADILRQNTWTEAALKALLSSMLLHSRDVDFLVVIYDFESWPSEIQSWWPEIQDLLSASGGSTCTFLTSSYRPISGLTPAKVRRFDLTKKYGRFVDTLIRSKIDHVLDHGYGSTSLKRGLDENIKTRIISSAKSFDGSFTAINTYLARLFQTSLSSVDAIEQNISRAPATEVQLYLEQIKILYAKPPTVFFWATAVLSWMLLTVRSFRIEELATAAALHMGHSSISGIEAAISMDMERDLRCHLGGLVVIENQYVRIISPLARKVLSELDSEFKKRLNLEPIEGLTLLCLHYLTVVCNSEDEVWENCLSQVSYRHRRQSHSDRALGFLDYASRFWPAHFLRVEDPSASLKKTVAEFLTLPRVANRWFRLHLLCNAMASNPLGEGQETSCQPAVTQVVRQGLQPSNISTQEIDEDNAFQLAAQMASYVGLASIIPFLLVGDSTNEPKVVHVRRGCSEHSVAVLDLKSKYYLECAIANDADDVVEALFNADRGRIADYFPLHKAALAGHLKTVRVLFNLLDNPAQADLEGRTPLHMAAICGSVEVIHFLLGNDASEDSPRRAKAQNMADVQDINAETPLIVAARIGNVEAAKVLAASGASLTIQDRNGKTALHHAVLNCPQLVEAFVAMDKIVASIADRDACTPLHIAARSGSVRSTLILINSARSAGRLPSAAEVVDGRLRTPLHYAAENGHEEIAKLLVKAGSRAALTDKDSKLPAELASACGHLETLKAIDLGKLEYGDRLLVAASDAGQLLVVHYLLQNKAASGIEVRTGQVSLSVAASRGFNEVVHTLLRNGADVNEEDSDRRTPLHHAAENGKVAVASILLSCGANVDAPDYSRYTPLHSAAMAGHVSVMDLLLRHGADTEASSRSADTPLHLAAGFPKAVELLLDSGADKDALDLVAQTPLHKATSIRCLESARLLINHGANIDAIDVDGKAPLHNAISLDDLPMVKEILDYQGRRAGPQSDPWPTLELAVKSTALNVFKFLVNGTPDAVKRKDARGRILLHLAAERTSAEMLTFLLESGSDVNFPGRWERTPLHDAAVSGKLENMRILLEWKAEVGKSDEDGAAPLHGAASRGWAEAVSLLLDAKASIDAPGSSGATALYSAAYSGRVEVVRLLLKAGANPNISQSTGWSPLQGAADNREITELLIAHKADINHQKDDRWTALHLSASWGHPDIVKCLLENGADSSLVTDDGDTALHMSFRRQTSKVMLNHRGSNAVDPNKPNGSGVYPIQLAIQESTGEVVRLLLDNGADFKVKTEAGRSCLYLAARSKKSEILAALLGEDDPSIPGRDWDSHDMVDAYWLAIATVQLEMVKMLVRRQRSLLSVASAEGFNGLETYLLMDRLGYGDEPLSLLFLDLGVDPFRRRRDDRKSAFELAAISRRVAKTKFFNSCLKFIPDDPSTSKLGFKELRIATEFNNLGLWEKLEPLKQQVDKETDQDGWSIDHFLYQSEPRISFANCKVSLDAPAKKPTSLILPPLWLKPGTAAGDRVNLSPTGREATFSLMPDGQEGNDESSTCLRADFPFPPRNLGRAYFEVTIHEPEGEVESDPPSESNAKARAISIGFSGEFCKQINAHPGWNIWSVGYHGDNGQVYQEAARGTHDTRLTFGTGNTIGCGINYGTSEYFFTLDGNIIGSYSSKVIFRKLYPCIGHNAGPCKISVNFGETEFAWADAKNLDLGESDKRQSRIRRAPTDQWRSRWRSHSRSRSRSPNSKHSQHRRRRSRSDSRDRDERFRRQGRYL